MTEMTEKTKKEKERFKRLGRKHGQATRDELNNPCAATDYITLLRMMRKNPHSFSYKQRLVQAHMMTSYLFKKHKLDKLDDFGV